MLYLGRVIQMQNTQGWNDRPGLTHITLRKLAEWEVSEKARNL